MTHLRLQICRARQFLWISCREVCLGLSRIFPSSEVKAKTGRDGNLSKSVFCISLEMNRNIDVCLVFILFVSL